LNNQLKHIVVRSVRSCGCIFMQLHDRTDFTTTYFNWLFNDYNFSKARMVAPWWWLLNRNM